MIAYRFVIEGEVTAADAAIAYDLLIELLARIADSLETDASQVQLEEGIRITLLPLADSGPAAGSGIADQPGRAVGTHGAYNTTSHLHCGSTDE